MGVWNSNDFLTWILYKFRITVWMILYNFTLLIYFSLQFLKLDFISLQTQFLYNFWKLFSLSLQFLKLAVNSLQFLKLTFISLQCLFLYDSDATRLKSQVLKKNHFWVKNEGEKWYIFFVILKFYLPLQSYLLTCQANSAFPGSFFLHWAAATL